MTLEELTLSYLYTTHFKVRRIGEDTEPMWFDRSVAYWSEHSKDYDVVSIDVCVDVSEEMQITHSVDVRPILLVNVKQGE